VSITNLNPHQLTAPPLAALVNSWKAQFTRSTAYTYRCALRRFLLWVDKLHQTDHAASLPKLPIPLARTVTADDAEFQRLYFLADNWMRAILLLTRTLGLRHSEALAITPRHLDKHSMTVSFPRKCEGTSQLPLSNDLAQLFAAAQAIDPDQPIVTTLRGHSVSRSAVGAHFNALKRRARVNPALHIHDLRRTAATRVYEETADLRVAQQLLGHTRLETTLHYLGTIDTNKLRDAVTRTAPQLTTLDTMPPASEAKQ